MDLQSKCLSKKAHKESTAEARLRRHFGMFIIPLGVDMEPRGDHLTGKRNASRKAINLGSASGTDASPERKMPHSDANGRNVPMDLYLYIVYLNI